MSADEPTDGNDIVDWDTARNLTGGDEALLLELTEMFPQESARHLAAIRTAIEERDGNALARAAHTLKSSAKLFGATTLAEHAQHVETLAAEGIGEAFEQAPELTNQVERVVTALKQGPGR